MLTFVGFLLTVLDFVLLTYYDYNYTAASANSTSVEVPLNGHADVIPRSLWILLAVFLFLAYTLGKLERERTRYRMRGACLLTYYEYKLHQYRQCQQYVSRGATHHAEVTMDTVGCVSVPLLCVG